MLNPTNYSQTMISALNNYDVSSLTNQLSKWSTLNLFSRFLTVKGFLLKRDFVTSLSLIELNEKEFKQFGLYSSLHLHIGYETSKTYSDHLCQSIIDFSLIPDDDFLQAEALFVIGISFLQKKDPEIAKEFFLKSRLPFQKANINSFVWRTDFNLMLCELKLRNSEAAESLLVGLKSEFFNLSEQCQAYFSRLLTWIFLYQQDFQTALSEIRDLRQSVAAKNKESELFLFKYEVFVSLKMGRKLPGHLIKTASAEIDPREKMILEEMLAIQGIKLKSASEVKGQIRKWEERNFDNVSIGLLADILLQKLLAEENFPLLLYAFKLLSSQIIKWDYIIPSWDLREYALVAYYKLNQHRNYEKLLNQFSATAPRWRVEKLQRTIASERHQNAFHRVLLDIETRALEFSGRKYDLSRKPKLFEFLLEIFSSENGVSTEHLSRSLYSRQLTSDVEASLRALANRFSKLIGTNEILILKQKHYKIAKDKLGRVQGKRNQKAQSRKQALLMCLQEAGKTGLSIKSLTTLLSLPRRTLQADLQLLLNRGKVHKKGSGRSSHYFVK